VPPGHERNVIHTYRYLRAAMIGLLVMLLVSVAHQALLAADPACWLGSISAYYYTPARTVFVGSLCALGVCLIAYKGHSPVEDVLLNFSGVMAFVVAMVPTTPDGFCGTNAYSQSPVEIAAAVRNNIWSLIVVLAAWVVISLVRLIRRRQGALAGGPPVWPNRRTAVATVVCSAILLVELVLFLFMRPRFIELSHFGAAITMVLGVIAVMVLSAFGTERRHAVTVGDSAVGRDPRIYKNIYLLIAGALFVALVVAVVLASLTAEDHLILWVEVIVLLLFCGYWAVQTHELWQLRETTPAAAATAPNEELRKLDLGSSTSEAGPADESRPAADMEGRVASTVAE
jgi:small-conductance mechanosensitive channel